MCELITQSSSIALIVERLALKSESGNTTSNARSSALESESLLHEQNNGSIIKPNQLLTAITRVDDQLQCLEVRWGWSPVWSMGTRPPLTHLPLEIVMRSKVFKRMNNSGRALVAVDGWFDVPAGRNPTAPGHFNCVRVRLSRSSSPLLRKRAIRPAAAMALFSSLRVVAQPPPFNCWLYQPKAPANGSIPTWTGNVPAPLQHSIR